MRSDASILEALAPPAGLAAHAISLSIVMALTGGLAALPLTQIDVAVSASGILVPATPGQVIRSGVRARVASLRLRDGDTVRAGDTLAILEAGFAGQTFGIRAELARLREEEADLRRLTAGDPLSTADLVTPRWRQDYVQFETLMGNAERQRLEAARRAGRTRQMASLGLSSTADLEAAEADALRASDEAPRIRGQFRTRWLEALSGSRRDRLRLEQENARSLDEASRLVFVAPLDGVVRDAGSVVPGAIIEPGEKIGTIVPSARLVAEVRVRSRDIGFVRVGMFSRILVDAYDHLAWGTLPARVLEVVPEYGASREPTEFRLRCELLEQTLHSRRGGAVDVHEGMTLRARLIVGRRSLLDLVRQKLSGAIDGEPETRTATEGA